MAARSTPSDECVEIQRVAATALKALDHVTRPGTSVDVAELLVGFVEMLDVFEPGPKGIELYEAALGIMPRFLYPRAAVAVARTHRWRSLPTPADFFAAVAGELAYIELTRTRLRMTEQTVSTLLNNRDHQRRMTGA